MRTDLSGKRFGRLQAIRFSHISGTNGFWECICECGKSVNVRVTYLLRGHTKSCGCLKIDILRKNVRTHGMSKTREYRIWKGMRKRCLNKNATNFKDYGGRGIKICDRWNDFGKFIEDMGKCPNGLTIERNNTEGDYDPSNCRWATHLEQGRNKRNNVFVIINGASKTITQWAKIRGVDVRLISSRIIRGWSPERAVLT